MSDPILPDDDETYLCWNCVGEAFLQAQIRNDGIKATCSYCGNAYEALPIGKVADIFELAFQTHYQRTRPDPNDLEEAMIRHGISSWPWERAGEPIIEVFKSVAEISDEVAEAKFADIAVDNILLNVADDRQLQLVLKVGSATQTVNVDGSGSTINTTDASIVGKK